MQIASDIGTPALVGLIGAYTYLRQATTEGLPDGILDLLLGQAGTLVLSLIIGYWLYRANQQQRQRLEAIQEAQVADLRAQIARLEADRDELLHQLLPDETPRPARRRAS